MSRFKYLILFLLLSLMPAALPAQNNGGDRLYNQAITLMEKGNRSSLNKAISTFKKAKLSYVSSEGKSKCDAMISECQRRLKGDNDPKKNSAVKKQNEARTKFDAAVSFKEQGDFENAVKYFKEAKELYLPTDSDEIAKCEAELLFCENPLQFAQPSLSVSCQGGESALQVNNLLKQEWTLDATTTTWIHPEKNAEGVKIVTDENETSTTRECTLTIKCGAYSSRVQISQYGKLTYKIDGQPDEVFYLNFKKNDKSRLLISGIQTPENVEWKIDPNQTSEWIKVDAAMKSIFVEVPKFTGKESGRKGKIAISYTLNGIENITFIPVYQGSKAPRKGWSSPKEFFSEK